MKDKILNFLAAVAVITLITMAFVVKAWAEEGLIL